MKKKTTSVGSAVATIDYFVKRGWDVSYDIGDTRATMQDAPEYMYILTICRCNKEVHLENYENLEDLLIGASAWLVDSAQTLRKKSGGGIQ